MDGVKNILMASLMALSFLQLSCSSDEGALNSDVTITESHTIVYDTTFYGPDPESPSDTIAFEPNSFHLSLNVKNDNTTYDLYVSSIKLKYTYVATNGAIKTGEAELPLNVGDDPDDPNYYFFVATKGGGEGSLANYLVYGLDDDTDFLSYDVEVILKGFFSNELLGTIAIPSERFEKSVYFTVD